VPEVVPEWNDCLTDPPGAGSLGVWLPTEGAFLLDEPWRTMTRTRRLTTRLMAAVAIVVPALLGSVSTSVANPKQSLDAAKSKETALQHQLEVLAEQVNTANAKLADVQARLLDARKTRDQAQRLADSTRTLLSERAVAAYEGAGSQLEGILGASDFNDFSDRVQYAGALAQSDADLAAQADAAGERAQWAADQYASVEAEQQVLIKDLQAKQDRFRTELESQQSKVADLQKAYQQWQAAQRAAALAAQAPAPPTGGGGTGGGGFVPPPNASAAQVAIAAARNQIGVTYVWGTSNPGVSFDCSGLTMYAWSQAGVYLPHSSAMQAAATPDVYQDQLQPGDLVFFYSPISHVGLYIGNGQMIDASHSGPGGEVNVRSVDWGSFVVGGRVG
jgi:cell wall-associated NlpC family hydrolase